MFKFTIRELLLLTVIVAILTGAWLQRRHLASENSRLRQQLKDEQQFSNSLVSLIPPVPGGVISPNPNAATTKLKAQR
jgi:hypothetical protein